ncbi:transglutaminase-like domain-containing protein [Candidatus Laterigemmans baculatus]|uniref:transglutaminase-like domain-containing protein n=1 Tax=Candidatus Laterigemmans baculatus TaxID=2770505 RepID=UPI0013DB183E|nr:transglutaminase-like domain-containing protein [Candidatus Laterigemmans baculatus]
MIHRLEAPTPQPTPAIARLAAGSWWLCGLLLLGLGCDRPPRPQVEHVAPERPRVPSPPPAPPSLPSGLPTSGKPLVFALEAPFDLWDAYFLSGEQIGYSHIHAEPTAKDDEIRYQVTERMRLRRGDSILDQHLQQTSYETLDGRLLRFEALLDVNGERTETRGEVRGDELVIETQRAGQAEPQVQERRIEWERSIGGLLALQQSLKEKPLAAGEQRRIQALAPMFYEVGVLDVRGAGLTAVPLLSAEPEQLLEAESISSIEGNPLLKMHLWFDAEGNVLKSYAPSLGLSIFRTDEQTAKQFATPEIDLMVQSRIPLEAPIERPRELRETVFAVQTQDPQLASRFLQDAPGQRVRQAEGEVFEVTVEQGLDRQFAGLPPSEEDRRSNPLIESTNRGVQELAAIPEATDEVALAKELARLVYTTISEKNLESGFSSAAEVAASRQGDCTEHAVLLAAMCRARDIPARVAAGLMYVDSTEGPAMAFHMWTLAHVDGGWLPLDGTMQDGLAAADRITLVSDNLASGTEYAMVAPVMQSLGQLEIQVRSTRHAETPSEQ